jgi:hypothetical protein
MVAAATSSLAITSVAVSSTSTFATPPHSTSLFSVGRVLKLDTDGSDPSFVASGHDSMFVVGTFDQLHAQTDDVIRIDLRTWRIAAAARYPNVTDVAFGDGALWWATGQHAFDIPAPDNGRVLFKIDPTNLHRERAFVLPDRTLLVTVASTSLWVATPSALFKLNPTSGQVLVKVPLDYSPIELSPSDGSHLDVLGSRGSEEFVTIYDAASGRRIAQRSLPGPAGGPLATTAQGVWVATLNHNNETATARYYQGDRLTPLASRGGYPFDTALYSGLGVIWLVDSGGQGKTECLAPSTGRVQARGGPLGVGSGSVATYGDRTFVLYDNDLTDYFLRVTPSKRCG